MAIGVRGVVVGVGRSIRVFIVGEFWIFLARMLLPYGGWGCGGGYGYAGIFRGGWAKHSGFYRRGIFYIIRPNASPLLGVGVLRGNGYAGIVGGDWGWVCCVAMGMRGFFVGVGRSIRVFIVGEFFTLFARMLRPYGGLFGFLGLAGFSGSSCQRWGFSMMYFRMFPQARSVRIICS